MVHKTKGIVLRTVKYGETSLICTVFTELLGLQSYMVKGARSAKAGTRKANQLFPSAMLDMVVYEQPNKNLQIIKEYRPYIIYQSLHEDVIKNGVGLFAVEVVTQLLAAHDPQPELYAFLEEYLLQLDSLPRQQISNFPLYFMIHAARISGYYISGVYDEVHGFADVQEGRFAAEASRYPPFIGGEEAALMSALNGATTAPEIALIKMNTEERRKMMQYFLLFLQLHVPHFTEPRSLAILTAILY